MIQAFWKFIETSRKSLSIAECSGGGNYERSSEFDHLDGGQVNVVAVLLVLWLAYEAGAHSGGLGLRDAGALGGSSGPQLLFAVAIGALLPSSALVCWATSREAGAGDHRVLREDGRRRLQRAAGDSSQNDFGVVADNWNRLAEKLSPTGRDQEAQDSLQKSVTEFLTVVSQIARGDLTLRGAVTSDALGNVVDSVNYMLDNFTEVLRRVRDAANRRFEPAPTRF